MSESRKGAGPVGYMVAAKRPERNGDGYRYESVGGIYTLEAAENHQAYCELSAEENPKRYGDVEYVITAVAEVATTHD